MEHNLYTTKEIAERLKVDYRTILREINRGNLLAFKVGRVLLISEDNLQKYLAKSGYKPLRVSVAVVVKDDKVLLVRRKFKEGLLEWQFPAGRVKFNEKTSTRAEIECLQETGVHCRTVKKLGYRVHPDSKVVIHYWLAQFIEGSAYNVDSSENSEVRWVDCLLPEKLFTTNYYPPVKNYLATLGKN